MRIIAGKNKGHHLVSFHADHIRPTTDRVKECMFNKFQFEIEGTKVLDLFCGTGNLGLEALSRGASWCHFVDKHPKSLEILQKNIEKLKIPKDDYKVSKFNVLSFIEESSSRKGKDIEVYDFIFIDPPFTKRMAHEVMESLSSSKIFHDETLISIESLKKERIDEQYQNLYRYDFRDFGDKVLSFYKKIQK